jgi:hypothetical protein
MANITKKVLKTLYLNKNFSIRKISMLLGEEGQRMGKLREEI